MREMKDSGIEWIGKIPKEWGIVKFKYLHKGLNTGEAIDKEYWESDAGPNAFYTAGLTPIRTGYSNFPTWKETGENDLLLARNGTPYVYLPVSKAYYTDHIIRAAMSRHVNRRFIRYCLQQSIASIVVDSVSIPTWSATLWNNQILTWPSAIEQERIAAFLDAECAEIDTVLEKTRASIEEYRKLKQAVITQAVTKGVRGDRPMKDSGIEWIGEIPEEWDCKKVKYVTSISRGIFNHRPRNDERCYGGEYPFIQTGDVAGAQKYIESYSQTLNELGKSVSKCFPKGTLTMTIAANVGDAAILGFDAFFPDSVVGFIPNADINDEYLYYIFKAMKPEFVRTAIKSTQFNLNVERIRDLFVPVVVQKSEQLEIAEYLNTKCADIDALIAKKQQYLTEIENYKKSLIYEYVTGKKEVKTSVLAD